MRANPILVSLCLLLAFCSAPVAADSLKPAPARGSDPFAGILDRGTLKSASPGPIADIASKRIAVILSNTTEKSLVWCEAASHGPNESENARMRGFHGQGYVDRYLRLHEEAYDPDRVVGRAVDPLVRKARSVAVIENTSEFLAGDYDLLAVVDISFVNQFPGPMMLLGAKFKAGFNLNVYFIDRDFVEVGQVETGETRKARMPPPFWDDVSALHSETLSKYQAKMDQLLGPDRPPAVEPATPATPTPGTPDGSDVSTRLKMLDELLRQGLITPAEGEAKRKAILDQL